MKRIFMNAVLIACLIGGMFFLHGCSKTPPVIFESVLSINTDESGSRMITATVSKATLKSLFGNEQTSFQSFIRTYCPESLIWTYSETAGTYELTFEISFDSLDEYQSKVDGLTAIPDSVTVTRPQVGVKTGFTLTEHTQPIDLFQWLISALKQRTGTSQARLDALFLNGANRLIYAEREYEQTGAGLYVYIETLLDAERIDILTDLSVVNVWNRSVRIRFPREMLNNASNVRPYLSSLLPEGISESWTDDTTWVLTFSACDIEQLGTLMNGLFQSQSGTRLTENVSAETSMRFVHTYEEPLNVAFFVPNTGESTVRYYVKNTNNARILIPDESGSMTDATSLNSAYQGYLCLYNQTMSSGSFSYSASYQYQPLEILVDTAIRSGQDICRTTTLEMGELPAPVHRQLMLESLRTAADGFGYIREDVSDDLYRITFSQTGTVQTINDGFLSLFGGSTALSYQRGTPAFLKKQLTASYSEQIDFRDFLIVPGETLLTCRLTFPGKETAENGENCLTVVTTDGICQMSGQTARPNVLRPWLIALAAFLGVLGLYLISVLSAGRYAAKAKRSSRRSAAKPRSSASAPAGRSGKHRPQKPQRGRSSGRSKK